MVSVPIRVLMINRQLNVAIKLKKALDKSGKFQMTTFTSPSAAFEYLKDNPQDVVVLDFTLTGMSGIDMVLRTRGLQPDVAIIASPAQPEVQSVVRDLNLDGISDMPTSARRLSAILETAYSQMRDALPDTAEAPPYGVDSDTLTIEAPHAEPLEDIVEEAAPSAPQFSSLDSVLVHVGGFDEEIGTETLDVDMSDIESTGTKSSKTQKPPRSIEFVIKDDLDGLRDRVTGPELKPPLDDSADDAIGIFQKIASEEPPVPTFEESGTVGDLMIGVGDTNLRDVVKILRDSQSRQPNGGEQTPEMTDAELPFYGDGEEEMGENTARMVLQTALAESAKMDYSLDEMVNNIESQVPEEKRAIRADLSAPELLRPHVGEPDFLPEDSAEIARMTRPAPTSLPEAPAIEEFGVEAVEPEVSEQPELITTDADAPSPPTSLPEMPFKSDSVPVEASEIVPESEAQEVYDEDISEPVEVVEDNLLEESIEAVEQDEDLPPLDEDRPETGPIAVEDEPEYETGFSTPSEPIADEISDDEEPEHVTIVEQSSDIVEDAYDDAYVDDDVPVITESELEPEDDPELARLALSLTQGSLELSAEATLLTRGTNVIAMAGDLLREDIDDISDEIGHDWEASENDTRIRFITLKATGQEYLIYTRRTEDDYSLSMIFAKNMRLSSIRRQSDQLIEALSSVPDVISVEDDVAQVEPDVQELTEQLEAIEEEITSHMEAVGATPTDLIPQVDAGPLTTYTFVWLVQDSEFALRNDVSQAVVAGLDFQLAREGWRVDLLQVHEDYLYIIAGIPGEVSAQELIDDLKSRTAEMAHGSDERIDPDALWSDSYLAFVPGRELDVEEIQRYINFARAR